MFELTPALPAQNQRYANAGLPRQECGRRQPVWSLGAQGFPRSRSRLAGRSALAKHRDSSCGCQVDHYSEFFLNAYMFIENYELWMAGSSNEHKGYVVDRIGLGEHGRGRLNEYVVLGHPRALGCDVDVRDPAVGGLHIRLHRGYVLGREAQA